MFNPMDAAHPPTRVLLTPGPSCISPRVYAALASPVVGHIDPWFTEFMGGVQELLRRVFQTANRVTFPISASGSGGIETAVVNALEPGDEAIVCVNGGFSERMAEVAERTGATIHRVSAPFGRPVDPEDVRRAGLGRKIKFVGLTHGETSTGVVTKIGDTVTGRALDSERTVQWHPHRASPSPRPLAPSAGCHLSGGMGVSCVVVDFWWCLSDPLSGRGCFVGCVR